QTETSLRVAVNLTQATILEFLDYLKSRTLDVADDFYIEDALAGRRLGKELDRTLSVSRSHIPESDELFVLDDTGRVVASSDAASIGRDDSATDYFRNGRQGMHIGDIVRGADGRPQWILAAPIRDRRSGMRLAVLANRIDPRALSSFTTGRKLREFGIPDESLRRGRTGELYLVNRDGLMITDSRFIDEAILNARVETVPVRAAMTKGTNVLDDYSDYRGVPVTGASALIPPLGWVVVAEIDRGEAIRPVRELQIGLALLGMGMIPAVVAIGAVIHRSVVRPMKSVLAADLRAAQDRPGRALLQPVTFVTSNGGSSLPAATRCSPSCRSSPITSVNSWKPSACTASSRKRIGGRTSSWRPWLTSCGRRSWRSRARPTRWRCCRATK